MELLKISHIRQYQKGQATSLLIDKRYSLCVSAHLVLLLTLVQCYPSHICGIIKLSLAAKPLSHLKVLLHLWSRIAFVVMSCQPWHDHSYPGTASVWGKHLWWTKIKMVAFSKNQTLPYFRPKRSKSKSIPYFRPKELKNHTLWHHTYLYSLHKGVPTLEPPMFLSFIFFCYYSILCFCCFCQWPWLFFKIMDDRLCRRMNVNEQFPFHSTFDLKNVISPLPSNMLPFLRSQINEATWEA